MRILQLKETDIPSSSQELAGLLLHTCYMGTEYSSQETKLLATNIASDVGSSHSCIAIDGVISAVIAILYKVLRLIPAFGALNSQDIALQVSF